MLKATTAANLDAERQAAPKANAKANMATEKERSRAPKASSPQAQHQVQGEHCLRYSGADNSAHEHGYPRDMELPLERRGQQSTPANTECETWRIFGRSVKIQYSTLLQKSCYTTSTVQATTRSCKQVNSPFCNPSEATPTPAPLFG